MWMEALGWLPVSSIILSGGLPDAGPGDVCLRRSRPLRRQKGSRAFNICLGPPLIVSAQGPEAIEHSCPYGGSGACRHAVWTSSNCW